MPKPKTSARSRLKKTAAKTVRRINKSQKPAQRKLNEAAFKRRAAALKKKESLPTPNPKKKTGALQGVRGQNALTRIALTSTESGFGGRGKQPARRVSIKGGKVVRTDVRPAQMRFTRDAASSRPTKPLSKIKVAGKEPPKAKRRKRRRRR